MADEIPAYRPRCKNIYCKAMLVYGESFHMDPDYQNGTMEFWCQLTSKGAGPDGNGVSMDECSDPHRGCFKEF